MAKIESSRTADVMLDWQATMALDKGQCYLVALRDYHIALLLSVIRYMEWRTRWRNPPADFKTVTDMVAELENCLMSGCNVAALIQVLDEGFQTQHEDMAALKEAIDGVTAQIAAGPAPDLEDDLAMLWAQTEQIVLVLGGAIAEIPAPL